MNNFMLQSDGNDIVQHVNTSSRHALSNPQVLAFRWVPCSAPCSSPASSLSGGGVEPPAWHSGPRKIWTADPVDPRLNRRGSACPQSMRSASGSDYNPHRRACFHLKGRTESLVTLEEHNSCSARSLSVFTWHQTVVKLP